jgi:capsular exopolysaccharide synthesis family protein
VFVVTVVLTLNQTPIYKATATFIVTPEQGKLLDTMDFLSGLDILARRPEIPATYVEVAQSSQIKQEAVAAFGLSAQQAKGLSVDSRLRPGTNVVEISAEGRTPTLVRSFADMIGSKTAEYMEDLDEAFDLKPLDAAALPSSPVRPNTKLNLALAVVLGLALGVGLAFVAEYLDTRLYTTERIEEVTSLPVLGRIPYTRKWRGNVLSGGRSAHPEAYRRLRTNIYMLAQEARLRTILVTSAGPGEGKSTIVTNLALTMTQSGIRVIAVDGDLRRPTLHRMFGLPNKVGLSNVLEQQTTFEEAAQHGGPLGLRVLTSGPSPHNPAELLGSSEMTALLEELAERFDAVLLDSPALLAVADAAVLAPRADGVFLVVGRAQEGGRAVQAARQQLSDVKARLLGVVVNRAQREIGYRYYDYYAQPEVEQITDPLTEISGIGPEYEKVLNGLGVYTFAQLAAQDPEDLAGTMGLHVTARRILKDRWIEQAQTLAKRKSHGRPPASEIG